MPRRVHEGLVHRAAQVRISWPVALRAVRAWLAPAHWLARCWRAWTSAAPLPELAALLTAVTAGHGLKLYLQV